MHDANGTPLKVGDKVIITGRITDLSPNVGYCNVTVETDIGRRPDGARERLCAINTGVMVKLPDQAEPLVQPTPAPDELVEAVGN